MGDVLEKPTALTFYPINQLFLTIIFRKGLPAVGWVGEILGSERCLRLQRKQRF